MARRRYELTDREWAIIEPLLPNKPRGVARVDDRRVLNGIMWRFRSGATWAEIPERYGPSTTCYNRFVRWRKAGDAWHEAPFARSSSGGWYTEILAPYVLNGGGVYYAASLEKLSGGTKRMMTAKPELYGKIRTAHFPVFDAADVKVPDNSVDVVLTFRNVHNMVMGGTEAATFAAFFAMAREIAPSPQLYDASARSQLPNMS